MPETATAGFFVVGGTLRRDAPSYILRAADHALYESLQNGEFCYLLTARQMGKSSLMVRTAARLRDRGTRVAVLDLTSIGQNLTTDQWYNGLVERAGQHFGCEDEIDECWHRFPQFGPMRRFMRAIYDCVLSPRGERAVIFVDEIDAVRSLPFSTDEFFAGIRECYNRRPIDPQMERLTFCLLGVATPSDLIRDTRTTPFNIGRRVELLDFTEEEAAPLIQGLGTDDGVGNAVLRRIIHWTGGHPYLTQRLCQAVAQEGGIQSPAVVDRLCEQLFLSNRARERDDNLLFVRERMLRSEVDTVALLNLYEKVRDGKTIRDDEANQLIPVLRLSGITRVEDGVLRVRNRIYNKVFDGDWVNVNMPGAEIRRQRAAYKRGLKRALLVTVPVLALVLGIAYRTIYLSKTTIAIPHRVPPPPPAFWASSRMQSSTAIPEIGGIYLRTGEPDVAVFVDNFEYGRTASTGDLRIPLPAAAYDVRLQKPGFQSQTFHVNVVKDQETQLSGKLQREVIVATSFSISGPPGAMVRLDGRNLGAIDSSGTFTSNTGAGTHTIELEKTGYLPVQVQKTFALGSRISIDGTMQADPVAGAYAALASTSDPSRLREFISKYPNSKYRTEITARLQELDWNNVKKADLTELDSFLQNYPQSPHTGEARQLVAQLQKEQGEAIAAVGSQDIATMQAYLAHYPQSQFADQVRTALTPLLDKQAVLKVLHNYQESYNRQDLATILKLWPSCPDKTRKVLRDSFQSPDKQTLKLDLQGDPDVRGNFANVKCRETRSGSLTSTLNVTITLVRQNGEWFIQSGNF